MTEKRQLLRLGVIVLFVYLIVTSIGEIVGLWQSKDKVTGREQTLIVLRTEREDLLRKKTEVNSQEYVERVARDNLGLSKAGEEAVIIAPELLTTEAISPTGDSR